MMLKATFLLQFRRVFPLPNFQRLCDIFLAFLGMWTVAGLIGAMTLCLPVSRNWDLENPIWECPERFWFWLAHGILHLITDLLIFAMPLPMLKTLPLRRLHKVVLIGVFCLGFLTCIISVVRLTTLWSSTHDPDASWAATGTMFWSLAEVTCSIVCLCIPTLRPLVGTWSCCAHRLGEGNIVERGTRRFRFYAISLPSTVGSPSPFARQPQSEAPIPIDDRA
ncbi:hypothetical protein B0I37DRAFT_377674 [Chaetomium sp. MPI-CAGE-AT-0009]|nr:hypothetical protein B0I37DRAFT_377674 [Chaetomium sp. MPI-CAGE-AT-0009]